MRLSYRVSLVIAIPMLVVGTGGLIAWRALSAMQANTEELADDLFREVTHETADRAEAHVRTLVSVLSLLAASIRSDPDALETPVLAARLADALDAEPDLARATFVSAAGEYVSLHREGGALRADVGALDSLGTLIVDELEVARGRLGRTVARERGEDPRREPFVVEARARGARVWLPPHRLPESRTLGVTCAVPVRSLGGDDLGVLAFDLDLDALSTFVQTLDLSPRSRVLLLAADGTLLAHPAGVARDGGPHHDDELLRAESVDDPAVRVFAAHLGSHMHGDSDDDDAHCQAETGVHHFHFELDGSPWLACVLESPVDEGVIWRVAAIAPADDFLGFVTESTRASVLVILVALLAAIGLALVLATRVSLPLVEVAAQMQETGRLELDRAPPRPSRFDEIAQMQTALQTMKGGLRSFASFVPRDVVRALLASGEEARLGGAQREVTIFFSDVAGFTSMSERVSPDELVRMLSGYLETMTEEIASNGGTIDKFIGDGIMAFWGAPATDDEHAARACEAAVLCQQRLDVLRADTAHAWMREARTRIGIATGVALVGNVGTPARMNYTAMGDVVNLAARLEGQNKAYDTEILVSEATYAAARARVVGRAIDVVAVKGKREGIRVYSLVGLRREADGGLLTIAELSERALDAYLARDFRAAVTHWSEILVLAPDDVPARAMRSRAEAFIASPPPSEWSGVHVSDSK